MRRSGPRPPRALERARGRVAHPSVQAQVLPSGLLVLLERDPYATAAGVVSVVRGGAAMDPVGAPGVAHLVEHLSFAAIDREPGTPLPLATPASSPQTATRRERLIRFAAAAVNGLTSSDAITFFEFGPTSRLPWLLELEGARLADPLAGVDDAAVALERAVISSEHRLRDDPRAGLWAASQLFPLLFPAGHPYARAALGAAPHGHLTIADARAYVQANFRPERMTLLVSAPLTSIDLDGIIKRLPAALVGDPRHPVTRTAPVEAAGPTDAPAGPVLRRTSVLPVPQLWIGWTLPNGYGPLGPTEALLTRWAQEDIDIEQLRQEDPHIRHVMASLISGQQASALLFRVLIEGDADPEHVAQVVAGRVGSLWARERGHRDLIARLKATVETELTLDEPPQLGRAIEQAELAALGPRPTLRAELMASVRNIASSELAKFAYDHLQAQRRHAVLFVPTEVAAEPAHRAGPALPGSAAHADPLFAHASSWDPLELPGATSPVSQIVMRKVASGLTVIVAQRRAASVTAWLGFHGGYSDADRPLVVELALRARPEAVEAAKYGALTGRGATRDASIETLEFRPSDLEPALEVLFAKSTASIQKWPPREVLERMVAAATADVDAASAKAAGAFWRALFGDHPFARVVTPTDLAQITRSDVDSWVGRVYNPHNAALVVVGDVNVDEVVRYATALSRKLGAPSWIAAVPPVTAPKLRPATAEHVAVVVTPRASALTDVRFGCLLPPMSATERPDYEILRLAIQERLASALRFERGEGYGVDVSYDWLRGGTAYLQIATFVDAEDLSTALATMGEHWRRWAGAGFDAGELNVARWMYGGQLSLRSASAHFIAFHLLNDWNADPAALGHDTFRVDPMSTTPARLHQLFATCQANAVLALTGSEPAIRHALAGSWPPRP